MSAGRLLVNSDDRIMNYWVITADERAFGPYEDYFSASEFTSTNIGMEGWTITTTS